MPRHCHGCLPMCCVSRKKRRSFSINEKENKTKANKVNPQEIENIRIIPSATIKLKQDNKSTSKDTIKIKPINEKQIKHETKKPNQQTKSPSAKDNKSLCSETSLSKFFHKSKQLKASSTPSNINDLSDDHEDKTANNTISSWSSVANSEPKHQDKLSKNQKSVQNHDLRKQNISEKKNNSQIQKISNDIKYTEKSKLVLENVRKLLKEHNIQLQQLNDSK